MHSRTLTILHSILFFTIVGCFYSGNLHDSVDSDQPVCHSVHGLWQLVSVHHCWQDSVVSIDICKAKVISKDVCKANGLVFWELRVETRHSDARAGGSFGQLWCCWAGARCFKFGTSHLLFLGYPIYLLYKNWKGNPWIGQGYSR